MQKRLNGIGLGVFVVAASLINCHYPADASKEVSLARGLPTVVAQSTSTTPSVTDVETSVFNQINNYRKSQNLSALTLHSTITEQARKHSQNMASGSVPFGHQGFSDQRLPAISKVITWSAAAENVAYNQSYADPATQAVQGWLNSSGHLKNIKGNYNLTGVGVAKTADGKFYFTQIFIKSP